MQSTGHTSTHTGQPEHSSGTITTSRPRSNIAPNSGGQLRTQVSHVMHSDDSIRRGGFFQASLRDRAAIRPDRPASASGRIPFVQGILSSPSCTPVCQGDLQPESHRGRTETTVLARVDAGTGTGARPVRYGGAAMTVPMFADLLRRPVVQAPMAGGVSTPALAASVSRAGGLGFLAAGYKTPQQVRAEVAEVRAATAEPFGVN